MKRLIILFIILFIIGLLLVFGINVYIKSSTNKYIINEDFNSLEDIDCILVLGAGVWEDKPSPILRDRLNKGIELYESGLSEKILMSGDHGRKEYDEVNIMKDYAISKGIDSKDIFMDHAGFSTYDSIYRAKEIFKANKIIIVSQKYHLYRALYIAKKLGLEAYGISAEDIKYSGDSFREAREILARDKDFIKCIFKPKPTFLGGSIPVDGDGNITNDKDKEEKDEI